MSNKQRIRPPSVAMLAGLPPANEKQAGRRHRNKPVNWQKPQRSGDKSIEVISISDTQEATIMETHQQSHTIPSEAIKDTNSSSKVTSWLGRQAAGSAVPRSLLRRIEEINATPGLAEEQKFRLIEDSARRHFQNAGRTRKAAIEIMVLGGSAFLTVAVGTLLLRYAARLLAPTSAMADTVPGMGGAEYQE